MDVGDAVGIMHMFVCKMLAVEKWCQRDKVWMKMVARVVVFVLLIISMTDYTPDNIDSKISFMTCYKNTLICFDI